MTAILTEKACAKVNLHLEVCGKRPDGYHDILSIMAAVNLFDLLKLTAFEKSQDGFVSVSIISGGGQCSEVLSSINIEDNLITKAVRKYLAGREGGVFEFVLEKNIPSGAGLGGGSSDAAAVFRILNKIYGFYSIDELMSLASTVGADVPFCVAGGSAICGGTGGIIEPVDLPDGLFVLIVNDGIHVDTREAYSLVDEFQIKGKYNSRLSVSALKDILSAGDYGKLYNDFEKPVFAKYPRIGEIKKELARTECLYSVMTGSGSTLIALYDSADKAAAAAGLMRNFARIVNVSEILSGKKY